MKLAWLLSATLLIVGCDEKKNDVTPPPAPTPTASVASAAATEAPTATAAPSASATPEVNAASDLPSEDDFWQEAEHDLSKDNMDAELAKLEKEIASPD